MNETSPSRNILIVDDEPSNIQVLVQALEDTYGIRVATNGPDALDLVSSEAFDLILLDVLMPGMTGHEVCQRLKAVPATRGIPVIFMTGRDEKVDELRGFELGAVDCIERPFSLPTVKARIRTHLELKRCLDLLENSTHVDSLTGIANRRRFDDFLDQSWRLALRLKKPLAVILIDVDDFKAFNESFGHEAGDACLSQVGMALAKATRRSTDLVARYEGEEFACVAPGTTADGALILARSLQSAVSALGIAHSRASAADHVTVSLGVAACVPVAGEIPDSLTRHANEALFLAKMGGRNQFVAFERITA